MLNNSQVDILVEFKQIMAPKAHISNPADSKSEVAASYIFFLEYPV